jgi:hypothetical protein
MAVARPGSARIAVAISLARRPICQLVTGAESLLAFRRCAATIASRSESWTRTYRVQKVPSASANRIHGGNRGPFNLS